MRYVRFCIRLLSLCMLLLLCACGADIPASDTASEEGTTEAAGEAIWIAGTGAPEYTVVRSDLAGAEDGDTKAAVLIRSYLRERGIQLGITTDWEKNPVSEYEIVVGNTLRTAEQGNTRDPYALGEEGYSIHVAGKRIYIQGGSGAAVIRAAERFLTDHFRYATGETTPLGDIHIPADYAVIEKQTYALHTVQVKDISLGDMTITWDTNIGDVYGSQYAETIQTALYTLCGLRPSIGEDGPAIHLTVDGGKMFRVRTDGENLVLSLGDRSHFSRGWKHFFGECLQGKTGELTLNDSFRYEADMTVPVTYEEFGAVGDGTVDDMPAIIAAHAYANLHGLSVRAKEGATYLLVSDDASAIVKTNTDWTGATFRIDDRDPDITRGMAMFRVEADTPSYTLTGLSSLTKEATNLGVTLKEKSVVILKDTNVMRYIRYGADANNGSSQQELIIVEKDGTIDPSVPLIWDYEQITSATVIPMDAETVTLTGGTFITICNPNVLTPSYYLRGLLISRSNVVLEGMTHLIENEGPNGSPYSGILSIQNCANVTVKNCVFTPHRYFRYPVGDKLQGQGTYDITPTRTVNLSFVNCTQTVDILDTAYWGIIGSNFCKNMVLDGCEFSRFDAHQGVANVTIKNSRLGHQGLETIGFGDFLIEDSTVYGSYLINLRYDYGSTWQGTATIRNCTWVPGKGNAFSTASIIGGSYNPFHDYGYDCYMPHTVVIDGLHIQDEKGNSNYKGATLFSNFVSDWKDEAYEARMLTEGKIYHVTENVTIKGLTTDKGYDYTVSVNSFPFRNTTITELD